MSEKISAFVITCDRDPAILRAALAAARFADELVLVNKGLRHGNLVIFPLFKKWLDRFTRRKFRLVNSAAQSKRTATFRNVYERRLAETCGTDWYISVVWWE